MSTAVIAGGDAPPVFQSSEHDLDFVALFIESFAKLRWMTPSFSRWDAGLNVFSGESTAKLIAIVTLVADQGFRALRQCRIDQLCADMIACLSSRQAHDQRASHVIDNGVKF